MLLRLVELFCAAVLGVFATARTMELLDIYCAEQVHLVMHLSLALAAWLSRGPARVMCLGVIYGAMRYRMDVQVYAPPPGTRLGGTVAVVTGATSGMGRALTAELASLGATVFVGARDEGKCERLGFAPRVTCLKLDLADLASVAVFAARLRAAGVVRVDALVNNAGFLAHAGERTAQGLEPSFGAIHLGHYLLTRELWPLLTAARPDGAAARVVNHASAAFATADFSSLLVSHGESDLRGEVMDGCLSYRPQSLGGVLAMAGSMGRFYAAQLGFDVPQAAGASLCPVAGVYSRAKLAQVLFTQELQQRADAARATSGGRQVIVSTLHPGTVQSGIVPVAEWLVRPTAMGARVLLYCLLGSYPPGSYVDEMQAAHDLSTAHADAPQRGKPPHYLYSVPIAAYRQATRGEPLAYRQRLWEVSEHLVAPHASTPWPAAMRAHLGWWDHE